MNFLRRAWKKIVAILTAPIDLRLFFWWRKKPKAAEHVVLDEPEHVSLEPLFLIPTLDTKKFSPGPRFVIERRRRAVRAGKIPGPTG